MEVKAKGSRTTIDFAVQPKGEGTVKVMRKGARHAIYEFQMSTDPSTDANWQRIYIGTHGRIEKSSLASGTRYYFRTATFDKNGMSPWSAVKSTYIL